MKKILLHILRQTLKITYPDLDKLTGELIKQKLEEQREEFWIALKSINSEIDEEFEGGLMNNVISPDAIALKVKKLTRDWRLQRLRLRRVAEALQVPIEEVVQETKDTIEENEQLNEIVDTVKPVINKVVKTAQQIEKIESGAEGH